MGLTGRSFAVIAIIEAGTWTGLLIGMFLKYVPVRNFHAIPSTARR